MTRDQFMQRFHLCSLPHHHDKYIHHSQLKSAAVLIPIIVHENQLTVLFTKRAEHLNHHPGQVSFPGGKVEPSDKSLIATALRETHEEIGLDESAIEVIGQLTPAQTISGYNVTPVVAFVSAKAKYTVDKNEVAEIFQVPLNHFLQQKNHIEIFTHYRGKSHRVYFMPYQHYNIWGATASMLRDLSLLLSQSD